MLNPFSTRVPKSSSRERTTFATHGAGAVARSHAEKEAGLVPRTLSRESLDTDHRPNGRAEPNAEENYRSRSPRPGVINVSLDLLPKTEVAKGKKEKVVFQRMLARK